MDTMNQMGNNMQNQMGGMMPEKKSYGALIAVIVILALIVIGGLYFLGQRMDKSSYATSPKNEADPITESLKNQSDSDSLSAIEKDLNSTNVSNLDQGATAMQAEVNAQ